jgi:type IV pilus assembly protein PilN
MAVHLYFSMEIRGMEAKILAADAKLLVLNKKVGDLERFKRDKREIEQKLAVIKSLEGSRLFPVFLFDQINRLVPAREIWLEKVSETGRELRIEGVARDNGAVARFMKSLETVGFFGSVDLGVSREKVVSGVKLQQFIVTCAIRGGS